MQPVPSKPSDRDYDEPFMQYEFLSGLDKTYDRRKRALVLRRHNSQRRKRESARQVAANVVPRLENTSGKTAKPAQIPGPRKTECRALYPRCPVERCHAMFGVPVNSNSLLDPFQTYGIPIGQESTVLLRTYLDTCHSMYQFRNGTEFNIQSKVFKDSLCSPALIATIQMYADAFLAQARGDERGRQVAASEYRVRSIHLINSALTDPVTAYGDSTILAILGLLASCTDIESPLDPIQRAEWCAVHIAGLRAILRYRKTLSAMAPYMISILIWIDTGCFGGITIGTTAPSEHAFSSEQAFGRLMEPTVYSDWCWVQYGSDIFVEEFLNFYSNIYYLAQERSNTSAGATQIGHLFQVGSTISRILNKSEGSGKCAKLAILLYVNSLIWDWRKTPCRLKPDVIDPIRQAILEEGFDIGGSLGGLYFLIYINRSTLGPKDISRNFLVNRILHLYSCLRRRTLQVRFEKMLLEFILADFQKVDLFWTPESFREDILDDLTPEVLKAEVYNL